MTILGKFTKQPREDEAYSFQFVEDMTETDNITSGYCALMYGSAPAPEVDLSAPYAATLADSGKLFYTGYSITAPSGAPIGYRLMAANTDQDSAIQLGPLSIPARGSAILLMQTGGWVQELAATAIVVSTEGDQRIRLLISGGIDKSTYKAQATAVTAEGRTMEDEMILKIKEV